MIQFTLTNAIHIPFTHILLLLFESQFPINIEQRGEKSKNNNKQNRKWKRIEMNERDGKEKLYF